MGEFICEPDQQITNPIYCERRKIKEEQWLSQLSDAADSRLVQLKITGSCAPSGFVKEFKPRWPGNPTTRIRSIGNQDLYLHDWQAHPYRWAKRWPKFYNEKNHASEDDFFLERDIFEMALIEEATKQKKPIFQSVVELNSWTSH